MAPSLSNARVLVHGISNAITRRGYAAAAASFQSVGKGVGARSNVMVKKSTEEVTEKVAWVPDPATGYYRPENRAGEIDVAELRAALLKQKPRA